MSRVALLDWDRSLCRGWMLTSWVSELASGGLVSPEAPAKLEELIQLYLSDRINHDVLAEQANCLYATELMGCSAAVVDRLAHRRAKKHEPDRFHSFAQPLLDLLNAIGVEPVVVSGAPVELIRPYARTLALGRFFGLFLEIQDGRYTGRILSNPGHSAEKLRIVHELAANGAVVELALGDSKSDDPLLAAARFQLVADNPPLAGQYGEGALAISTSAAPLDEVLHFVIGRLGTRD